MEEKNENFISNIQNNENEEENSDWNLYKEFVTFYLNDERYAVPIFMVHDIKGPMRFTKLPNEPDYVLGVINLRGNVIPVFDMKKIISGESYNFSKQSLKNNDNQYVILVLNINGKINGCLVDSISDVVVLEPQDKHATPLFSRKIKTEYIKFVGRDSKKIKNKNLSNNESEFLIVLDMSKIIVYWFSWSRNGCF